MGRWDQQIPLLGVLRRALRISMGAQPASISVEADAGIVKDFRWGTGQLARWLARSNGDAESTANAGSNFEMQARADDGSLIGIVFSIARATRQFDFKVAPTVNGVAIGSSYTNENAMDAIAAMFAAGSHSGISFSYNDAGDAISATVSGGGSSSDVRDNWLFG